MIHRVDRGSSPATFVISADNVWRPGSFESERAARMGQRLDDADIATLQREANRAAGGAGGIITEQAIRDYRARARTPQ